MEIVSQRGDQEFLVKDKDKYHFVSLSTQKVITEDDPNTFFRFGYWVDVNISRKVQDEVLALIK